MAKKVLKVDMIKGVLTIGDTETQEMKDYSLEDCDFVPNKGDVVNVYRNGDSVFIQKEEPVSNVQSEPVYRSGTEYSEIQAEGHYVNKIIYAVLALTLGLLGVHHFYAGNTKKGTKYLLLTLFLWWTGISIIVMSIYCIIDAVKALKAPSDRDGYILIEF